MGEQLCPQTYSDDGSGTVPAQNLVKKRLLTRYEPFGVRLYSWYTPGPGEVPVGDNGGRAGFLVEPAAVQRDPVTGNWDLTSAEGGPSLNIPTGLFVDGGLLWFPYPATIYLVWPDRSARNTGLVYWSNSTWTGEGVSDSLGYTLYLEDGQTVPISPYSRKLVSPAPGTGLELDGGIVIQTGEGLSVGGSTQNVKMRFLAVLPGVTHAPLRLYYSG